MPSRTLVLWPTAVVLLTLCAAGTRGQDSNEVAKKVQDNIKNHPVQIFSKSYCPFCKNTKALLDSMKVKYHADELDQLPDGSQMQEELAKLTGQKTVPNIFIGGVHVGGNDALVHAKEKGKLQKLFESAGVTDAEL